MDLEPDLEELSYDLGLGLALDLEKVLSIDPKEDPLVVRRASFGQHFASAHLLVSDVVLADQN